MIDSTAGVSANNKNKESDYTEEKNMKKENNENSAPAAATGDLIEIGAILNVSHTLTEFG